MLTVAVAPGAAVTDVGPEALKALVGALAPRQNLDGTWTYHNALKSLELYGASSLPFHPAPLVLLLHPACSAVPRLMQQWQPESSWGRGLTRTM